MTFNEKIDKFMMENNIENIKQLAMACDIPYTTLNDFYNKQSADNSRLSTIRKLSKYMGCSMDYLSFDEINEFTGYLQFDNAELTDISSNTTKIPVLGFIKAGIPIEAQENIIDYIDIPSKWTKGNKKYYGLKIDGDSMKPNYNENDIVIFLQTNEIQNGKDCAVMVNCTECTFKKVYVTDQGLILQPYNNQYEPMIFTKKQVEELPIRIVGIAVEKRTKL